MKRTLLTIIATILCTTTISAQQKTIVTGDISLAGGMGNATPWDAKAKFDIANAKIILRPFIEVKGVSEESSAIKSDTYLKYTTASGDYTSSLLTKKSGTEVSYGTDYVFIIDMHNQFNGSVSASHSRLDGNGFWNEDINSFNLSSSLPQHYDIKSHFKMPVDNTDRIKADIMYSHIFTNPAAVLYAKYSYEMSHNDYDNVRTADNDNGNNGILTYNNISQNLYVYNRTAVLGSTFALGHGSQNIDFGMKYNDNTIDNNSSQKYEGTSHRNAYDVHFNHHYRTASAFARYTFHTGPVTTNAGLEYAITHKSYDYKYFEEHSESRNLKDLIPSWKSEWVIDKKNALTGMFQMRIIQPTIAHLNPVNILGVFSNEYGNPDIELLHNKTISLCHNYKSDKVKLTSTLSHSFADDGFNAIWIYNPVATTRLYTYGNDGIRRVWSMTESLDWKAAENTSVKAEANVNWDKRVAEAINMEKEHWGYTLGANVRQVLTKKMQLGVHGRYSEGNTIDLYSHAGKMMNIGGDLSYSFLKSNNLTAKLAYDYNDYAKTIITQGAYTGEIFTRPDKHNTVMLSLSYRIR